MKKNLKMAWVVLLLPLIGEASKLPSFMPVDNTTDCRDEAVQLCQACKKLLDSDIPFPFQDMNMRAELREGEMYKLVGRVLNLDGTYYLAVDPNIHPWLTNRLEPVSRVYPIGLSNVNLRPLDGLRVQFVLQAQGRVEAEKEDPSKHVYRIYLHVFHASSAGLYQ